MNYPDQSKNPARQALTRTVNKAIADGTPIYTDQPAIEYQMDTQGGFYAAKNLGRGDYMTLEKATATMTESEVHVEIESILALCRPLWTRLEHFSDNELVGSGRTYSPCADVRALRAQLKPLEDRLSILRVASSDFVRQRTNDLLWTRKMAAVAAAPVYQHRNGWEIVRLDPAMPVYNLRDPQTKEEVYTGSLRRCREVANESKPEMEKSPCE